MTTTDRYIVTTSRGEPAVRTNSLREAERLAEQLGGTVVDQQAATE